MARLIREIEAETVGELRKELATCSDDLEIFDSVGELLLMHVYEEDGKKWLEVQ